MRPNASPVSRRRDRTAFTLIEMIASLVIMSILLVAMGGALVISSQAVPDEDNRTTRIIEASEVVDQIASELTYAITVSEMTETAVTFTVADRDSDSVPETIRYAWSGTAGDPLTREYNGGAAVNVLEDVHAFSLTYGLHTEVEAAEIQISEGAETELVSHDVVAASADFAITGTDAIAQYFLPTLPAEATAWSITRVLFMARANGTKNGETAVRIRPSDGSSLPAGPKFEEHLMGESGLGGTYAWQEFAFSEVSDLAPDEGVCLTLVNYNAQAPMADIQYDAGSGSGLATSSDGGETWSSAAGQSLRFFIYGTVQTSTTIPGETREYLRTVTVALQVGGDSTADLQSAARIFNEPEVTP
ncbi:MAG: type II secretion system protein [Planctomycetota bacterium]|nr:type II secretion system protein [Planctomycetota bacterium]